MDQKIWKEVYLYNGIWIESTLRYWDWRWRCCNFGIKKKIKCIETTFVTVVGGHPSTHIVPAHDIHNFE